MFFYGLIGCIYFRKVLKKYHTTLFKFIYQKITLFLEFWLKNHKTYIPVAQARKSYTGALQENRTS